MAKDYDKEDGVWRTIGGRKVFIRKGQNLADAMKESGKFKKKDDNNNPPNSSSAVKKDDENVPEEIKKRGLTDRYLEKKKQMEEWLKETNSGKLSKAEEEALEYQREKHGEEAYQKALAETKKGDDTFKKSTNPNNDSIKSKEDYDKYKKQVDRFDSNKNNNLKKLEEDTRDLSDYDKYNLAVSKLENKENMSSDEKHFWNGAKMDYERKQKDLENTNAKQSTNETKKLSSNSGQEKINDNTKVMNYNGTYIVTQNGANKGEFSSQGEAENFAKSLNNNDTMNNVIREKASNKYEGTKRWGFGYANDDNVPVYNNKIDYTGDFTHANLQTLSDSELKEALNKQTELLNKANAEKVGDRRTRNGRMQAIFNKSEKLQYNNGVNRIKEELVRRENEKYPQYKGTPYEVKYYSLEDVMKDKDSPLNQYIRNKANEKKALNNAWNKYKEEHPNTEMTKSQFKKDIYKK